MPFGRRRIAGVFVATIYSCSPSFSWKKSDFEENINLSGYINWYFTMGKGVSSIFGKILNWHLLPSPSPCNIVIGID